LRGKESHWKEEKDGEERKKTLLATYPTKRNDWKIPGRG